MNRNNSNKQENEPFSFWESLKEYKNLIIGFIAVNMLAYIAVPLILTCKKISFVSYTKGVGEIGDTIGGTVGPIIAIIAAILTFVAYLEQIKLNREQMKQFSEQEKQFKEQIELQKTQFNESLEEQKRQFDIQLREQDKITQRQRFESHFFELLKMYNDLVKETELEKIYIPDKGSEPTTGRKVFEASINRLIYFQNELKKRLNWKQDTFIKFCDLYLTDQTTFSIIEKDLISTQRLDKTKTHFYQPNFGKDNTTHEALFHAIRLFHRIIKYVTTYDASILSDLEKYSYIQILRSQLSSAEQEIILLFAISEWGVEWRKRKYLTKWMLAQQVRRKTLEALDVDSKILYQLLGVNEKGIYEGEDKLKEECIFRFAD